MHKKIITGFVIQTFVTLPNGTHVCNGQEFVAGDPVEYENEIGETVGVGTKKEVYCPYMMVQPINVVIGVNAVKLAYKDGVCPVCGKDIPDDVVDGQSCENCELLFCLPQKDNG